MESHLGDVVRMGEIAAMMFDKDEGLLVFATTHLDEMLQEFRRRYYAWTSRYEALAPIGQEAQPAAANSTCQTVEAVEKKVRLKRRTFEPSFSWLVPKIASYGFC